MRESTKKAIQLMTTSPVKDSKPTDADYLSTGLTLLNLATYGRTHGGLLKGHIYRFAGRSSSGKAQPLTSKILTPTGWVMMGDLSVADAIIDPDGGISYVMALYPQGPKLVYEVLLSDGSKTRCTPDHFWTVETSHDKSDGRTRTLTLRDMREGVEEGKKFYIPFTKPVEYEQTWDLPMHPYLLGVLIGNGFLGQKVIQFSSVEEEIIQKVRSLLPPGQSLNHASKGDYRLIRGQADSNIILEELHRLGLAGCLASKKFIPREYLLASVENRRLLLAGLMDTDGYAGEPSGIDYSTSSKTLAQDVVSLVRSLGGRATIGTKESPKYTYRGVEKIGQPNHRVYIRFFDDTIPFTLRRKADRCHSGAKQSSHFITKITFVGMEECQCINTSSQRSLYVTDDFIVTHNTFICRTILAEAANNSNFDNYELIYDDVEDGALMDTEKFFGSKLVKRLIPPSRIKGGLPMYSKTIGDFYSRLNKKLDSGRKVIWICDSLDSLKPDSENKMTDNKAKMNSQEMRKLLQPLKETGSMLILVSQVRADMRSLWGGDIISGGMAPEFYATLEVILRKSKTLKVTYKGKKHVTGSIISARIKKNRISGREQVILFPFSPDYGIDDIGANVDFLLANKHWEKREGVVEAPELKFSGTKANLIKSVEELEQQRELQILTGKVWKEIRDATITERRPRYS